MATLSSSIHTSGFLRTRRQLAGMALRLDWLALVLTALLLAIGVAFIYGAGVEIGGFYSGRWSRQLMWIGVGTVGYAIAAAVDYRRWCKYSWILYLGGIAALLCTLLFGKTLNNTQGWISIPGLGLVQPVEGVKPLTLLFLAWIGTRPPLRHTSFGAWTPAVLIAAAAALPILLICLQPDTGTAMVFVPLTLAMILLSGMKWRWFFLGAAVVILAVPMLFSQLKPYQKDRVKVFAAAPAQAFARAAALFLPQSSGQRLAQKVNDFLATSDGQQRDDWNAVQSLLAVGSGGLHGKGYLKGTLHTLGYLPRTIAPTDFIFSVIAEETGFIGAATVISLFAILLACLCRTALNAATPEGTFICFGTMTILATHTIINISMTIQAAPIVGIPLPLVSYGGSAVIGMLFMLGLVQSVQLHTDPLNDQDTTQEATP